MKKTNFVIFTIFFIAVVAWVGVYIWDNLANQKDPSIPPSPMDIDEATQVLEELQQKTGLSFSMINTVNFEWHTTEEKLIIQGKSFEATEITNEEYDKVEIFLLAEGFELNEMNIAAGTVSDLSGYQRNNMVCVIVGGFSGYKDASEDWTPVSDVNDIEVSCGEL